MELTASHRGHVTLSMRVPHEMQYSAPGSRHAPSPFILSGDARPLAPLYHRRMKTALLIAGTGAAGGLTLIVAGWSLAVSPEPPASVGVLVAVGSVLVALSTLGMLGRWVLAR